MGDEYGIFNLRETPVVGSVKSLTDRRYLYQNLYGDRQELPPAYQLPFASRSGEPLINPNTRYFTGSTDMFGGFEAEPGLRGTQYLQYAENQNIPVYTPPVPQQTPPVVPTPAPAQGGLMPTGTMLGNSQAVTPLPMESMAPQAMAVPTSLAGQELSQVQAPTSVAGDVGNFFKSKQGGALLAAGGVLLASGVLGGRPDESPITDRIKELEGTDQYGRFLDIASRTAPSRADYLGVMAARGGSAVQAEEAAQAAQSRAAREAVSEYNRYRVAADAQAAELRLALQQQREQRRLAKIQGFGAALGTAAGFLLAGPTGAQIGGALGSGAGSVLGDLGN